MHGHAGIRVSNVNRLRAVHQIHHNYALGALYSPLGAPGKARAPPCWVLSQLQTRRQNLSPGAPQFSPTPSSALLPTPDVSQTKVKPNAFMNSLKLLFKRNLGSPSFTGDAATKQMSFCNELTPHSSRGGPMTLSTSSVRRRPPPLSLTPPFDLCVTYTTHPAMSVFSSGFCTVTLLFECIPHNFWFPYVRPLLKTSASI